MKFLQAKRAMIRLAALTVLLPLAMLFNVTPQQNGFITLNANAAHAGGLGVTGTGCTKGDVLCATGTAGVGDKGVGAAGKICLFGVCVTAGAGTGGLFSISFGSCGGESIGSIICNANESIATLPGLLSAVAYLLGLLFGVIGVIKVKEHVEMPNQVGISEPVKRFIAGGAFFALPIVMKAAVNTLTGGDSFAADDSAGFNTDTSGNGLDAMMVALMADIWTPMSVLLGAFSYLAGIVFIMIGISRLVKSAEQGPRGPAGAGTIATFLTAGALFSVDSMLGGWSTSLFGTNEITTYASLAFTDGLDSTEIDHVNAVISSAEAFLMILGWISFVRGFFIIRGVAEGEQQASLMSGLTHLFGGALAVNLGPVMNAVQYTLGLDQYGVSFGYGA